MEWPKRSYTVNNKRDKQIEFCSQCEAPIKIQSLTCVHCDWIKEIQASNIEKLRKINQKWAKDILIRIGE